MTAPPEPAETLLGIQEVARMLGISARTLRFYEDKGLIQPVRIGAMRAYSRREVGRMRLVLRGKRLGFFLREISEFLDLYDVDRTRRKQMQALAQRVDAHLASLARQREAIDLTIAELNEIRRQTDEWMARG